MDKILVTGSNGFTGKYVCESFTERGYNVVGLVNSDPESHERRCDLTDAKAVQQAIAQVQPDGVVHLAAQSFVGHADERSFYDINLFGTLNLLDALEQVGRPLQKVVIASSANVYGQVAKACITETTVPNPVNHYAVSKLAMECMVKARWDRLPTVITRPFNYTGPGQQDQFLIPKIVSHFRQRKAVIELGNLDVARDFSDVRDVAAAYLALYEASVNSEIVNLCSGRVYGLGDIIAMMNQIAGYDIEVVVNPDFVRSNEIKVLGGDNSKFSTLVGVPPRYAFTDTLQSMYYEC
jgi:nucleoside-diphosphate-sugar epimerase